MLADARRSESSTRAVTAGRGGKSRNAAWSFLPHTRLLIDARRR